MDLAFSHTTLFCVGISSISFIHIEERVYLLAQNFQWKVELFPSL